MHDYAFCTPAVMLINNKSILTTYEQKYSRFAIKLAPNCRSHDP